MMQHSSHPMIPIASSGIRRALRVAATCLLAAATALPALGGVFPDQAALTLKFSDEFSAADPDGTTGNWVEWENVSTTLMNFGPYALPGTSPTNARGGSWGTHMVGAFGHSTSWWGYMLPKVSRPTDAGFNADEWTNIQIEFDVGIVQTQSIGFIWAAQDADSDGQPEAGYTFRLRGITPGSTTSSSFPNNEATVLSNSNCAGWELHKITAENTFQLVGRADINSACTRPLQPPTTTYTVSDPTDIYTKYLIYGQPYRLRLSWFCGNLQVQIVRVYNPVGTNPPVYRGCGAACGTGSLNVEDCWCTVLEWSPLPLEQPLGAGAAGVYAKGTWSSGTTTTYFDNAKFSYWDPDCGLVCGPWTGWAPVRTDIVPMKFLYEGSLLDLSAGRKLEPAAERGKIDVETEAPAAVSSYNHSLDANPYCNGWNLLADLPAPAGTTNLDTILAYLEPMQSAVDYESASGAFSWVADYDNDPLSVDFNPVPMIADGSTPINSSLLEAFDWYVGQVTTGDWADDPYEECRQWYVILITDGDEACEFSGGVLNPDAVCEPGGAASKFASPPVAGVPALPVYTIGFSETIAADSPLACIAEETGGEFFTAANASQLKDALYNVFYTIQGEKRSFSPFKVAPPPSSVGGNPTRDYLAVYPLFQPLEGKTLWAGNLWAFPLNSEQRSIPTTGDCDVDTSQLVWNAADALQAQLDAHTEANPQRFVFMGSNHSGSWQRYDLATMPDDPTLQAQFKAKLDIISGVSDVEAQQIVNFLRNTYLDDDYDPATPGPPLEPRPDGYPVLGDFFHSQPLVVNPPNNPMYFYDFGFGAAGEAGAHNYADFMTRQAKRRRVVLAGANDGMLHAFDGGVWNRDRVNEDVSSDAYDQIHDLGTGTELFAWVPQAVMPRLYDMTAGGSLVHTEQQYLVDGPVVKGDAFIDGDGDGDREWRTVALTSMRRGGRGILALDITQPDPVGAAPEYVPALSTFAGCRVGSTSGCDGEWPKVLWEFSDTADANGNGAPDLGWTWSRPTIARIAVYNGSNPDAPNDVFVAFFGGGWDASETDVTGTYFYGVNVATGAILLKTNLSVALPGGITALDSDVDGFHDRIYFADSDGGVHRLQFPSPTSNTATGATAGTLTRIFDFSTAAADGGFPDRQQFFTRPVPVATSFDGSSYTWALALGSGDRANLDDETTGIDHFFFLVDAGDTVTRGKSQLQAVDYSDLTGAFDCADNYLVPPFYGWYLSLRDTEKLTFDATVLNGYVYFPTFDPSTAVASHNVPDQCGGSASSGGGGGSGDPTVVCRASGISRTYKLWYECGLGDYSEVNDIVTGSEAVDIDGEIAVVWTDTTPEKGDVEEGSPVLRTHRVTNWRQE
jgi:type IV pilus assembly protein PilY1